MISWDQIAGYPNDPTVLHPVKCDRSHLWDTCDSTRLTVRCVYTGWAQSLGFFFLSCQSWGLASSSSPGAGMWCVGGKQVLHGGWFVCICGACDMACGGVFMHMCTCVCVGGRGHVYGVMWEGEHVYGVCVGRRPCTWGMYVCGAVCAGEGACMGEGMYIAGYMCVVQCVGAGCGVCVGKGMYIGSCRGRACIWVCVCVWCSTCRGVYMGVCGVCWGRGCI